jgi:hypothetical protein
MSGSLVAFQRELCAKVGSRCWKSIKQQVMARMILDIVGTECAATFLWAEA